MSAKTEFTPENKFRWISKMYFSVSDSPVHDVNPFTEIEPFLKAKVGDMDWGNDKAKSKEKFVGYLSNIFNLYDFIIPKEEILKSLSNEKQTNSEFVTYLASISTFPEN